jgi:hypothetical protein
MPSGALWMLVLELVVVLVVVVRVLVVEVGEEEPSTARVQLHGYGVHADDSWLSG